MQSLFQSATLVFASEFGDKTQLLALVLATRFKRPFIVLSGIAFATIVNHGLAAIIGHWLSLQFSQHNLKLFLSLTFLIFAIWLLIPDKIEDKNENETSSSGWYAFGLSAFLFFFAEMGDKTQLATVALSAQFKQPWLVTFGTVVGLLLADAVVVIFGDKILKIFPLHFVRIISAALFAVFALFIYFT